MDARSPEGVKRCRKFLAMTQAGAWRRGLRLGQGAGNTVSRWRERERRIFSGPAQVAIELMVKLKQMVEV